MTLSVIFVATALLLVGLAAGFVMHRSDFCMAGAFRDLFLFRSAFMLRPLFLLIVMASVLFETERQLGLIDVPFPFFTAPTLFSLLGGVLFGFGMVIAGGCVMGVLYKLGSGSRPALFALAGLVFGSALYAEWHSYLAPLVKQTTLTKKMTLPQLIGLPALWLVLVFVLLGSTVLWRWWRGGRLQRFSQVTSYLQPWQAALILALLSAVSAAVAGVPFGVTTSYLKWAAGLEQWFFPEHMSGMTLFIVQPVQLVLPFSGAVITGGAGPALDAVALIQYPLIGGIVLGAAFSTWRLREWCWRGRVPVRQLVAAFAGGILMAFGSRLSPGCNVWHLWGGLPIFALSSILFVMGLFPGAWLGSRFIARVVFSKET